MALSVAARLLGNFVKATSRIRWGDLIHNFKLKTNLLKTQCVNKSADAVTQAWR